MHKKETGVNRIVGADKASEQKYMENFAKMLNTKIDLRNIEVEKTQEFILIYKQLYQKLRLFFAEKGIDCPEFPVEGIHLILDNNTPITEDEKIVKDLLKKQKNSARAGFVSSWQKIFVNQKAWENGYALMFKSIVHELIHFIMFNSWQPKGKLMSDRRVGLVMTVNGKSYFNNTNEFITETLAQEFQERFFPEIDILNKSEEKRKQIVFDFANDMGENPEKVAKRVEFVKTEKVDGGWSTGITGKSYYKEIKEHNELIDYIYEANKQELNKDGSLKYKSRQDVLDLFIKAAYTGKVLELARLIEKTYGKGSFRLMGESTIKK
jgi:hypothetical protein